MGIWNTVQKWQGKSVPPCSMIVAAAGSSCRMGGQDKLFAPLAGVPVRTRTLRAIDRAELVSEIVVAAQEERMEAVAELCAAAALHKKVKVVKGGASRTESVLAAALAGLFGILAALGLVIWYLCTIESDGVAYMAPFVDSERPTIFRTLLRRPQPDEKFRPPEYDSPNRRRQR